MDIELARTFLEIISAGSFIRASERLHVTQTAVSARIQALEAQLGRAVFIRNKAGAHLTPAGREFVPYATQLVQVWERARHQVAMPPGYEAILSLGGDFALWNSLLLNWLVWLHRDRPSVALRSSVDTADRLLDRVQTGVLDMAVMYAPHHRPGVEIVHVLEEELIAVSTEPHRSTLSGSGYVYVDWGPEFVANHDVAFPDLKESGMFVGLGPLALRYVLEVGGTGYFRTRAVQGYLKEGRLFRMEGTPTFSYSVFAALSVKADDDLMKWAQEGLTVVAAQSYQGWI